MGLNTLFGIGLCILPIAKILLILIYSEITKEILIIDLICAMLAIFQFQITEPLSLLLIILWIYQSNKDYERYYKGE